MERWEIEALVMFVVYMTLYIFVIDPFVGRVTGFGVDPFAPHDRGEMLLRFVLYPRGWIFLLVSAALVAWFILSRMPDELSTDGNHTG